MKRSLIITGLMGLLLAGKAAQAEKISSMQVGRLQKEYKTASADRKKAILEQLNTGGYPLVAAEIIKAEKFKDTSTTITGPQLASIGSTQALTPDIQKKLEEIADLSKQIANLNQQLQQEKNEQQNIKEELDSIIEEGKTLNAKISEKKDITDDLEKKLATAGEDKKADIEEEMDKEGKAVLELIDKTNGNKDLQDRLNQQSNTQSIKIRNIEAEIKKLESQMKDLTQLSKEQIEINNIINTQKDVLIKIQNGIHAGADKKFISAIESEIQKITKMPDYNTYKENKSLQNIKDNEQKITEELKKLKAKSILVSNENDEKKHRIESAKTSLEQHFKNRTGLITYEENKRLAYLIDKATEETKITSQENALEEIHLSQYLAVKTEIARINNIVEQNAKKSSTIAKDDDGDYVTIQKDFFQKSGEINDYEYYQLLIKEQDQLFTVSGTYKWWGAAGTDKQPIFKLNDKYYINGPGSTNNKKYTEIKK